MGLHGESLGAGTAALGVAGIERSTVMICLADLGCMSCVFTLFSSPGAIDLFGPDVRPTISVRKTRAELCARLLGGLDGVESAEVSVFSSGLS